MIVLHAAFVDGRVHIWGEAPAQSATGAPGAGAGAASAAASHVTPLDHAGSVEQAPAAARADATAATLDAGGARAHPAAASAQVVRAALRALVGPPESRAGEARGSSASTPGSSVGPANPDAPDVARAQPARVDASAELLVGDDASAGGLLADPGGASWADATITLRLPAHRGVPIPSPRLSVHHAAWLGDDPGDAAIEAFEVPALRLEPEAAPDVLESLTESAGDGSGGFSGGVAPSGVLLARSVEYFATLSRLSRHLLAQQRFVPMLMNLKDGGLGASWRPWLADEASARRFATLVSAMPPSARAGVDPLAHDPWQISEAFLASITDAACRRVMLDENMGETIEGLDPARDVQVSWLTGLLQPAPSVLAQPAARQEMTRRVRTWIAGLEDRGASAAWRLLLQLHEPDVLEAIDPKAGGARAGVAGSDGSDLTWRLTMHLQAVGDEAIVLDAEDIWLLSGEGITLSGRRCDQPKELLLREMGRAARLYKPLEKALEDAEPASLELTTRQAYEFLREARSLLSEQGFGVKIPEWWDSPLARLGARLRIDADETPSLAPEGSAAAAPASSSVGLTSLVNYRWEISLGDTTLSLHEFEQLANKRTPLVRVAGRWVEVRPEDVRAAIKFIGENPGGRVRLVDAMRLAYASDTKTTGLPVVGLEARGWVSALLSGDASSEGVPDLDTPATFVGTLRPYQRRGLSWMSFMERAGLGVCLADDMGLGKTIQLLALLMHEREVVRAPQAEPVVQAGPREAADPGHALPPTGEASDPGAPPGADGATGTTIGPRVGPTLLIVPMSVVGNWMHETRRFCPALRVHIHHGPDRPTADAFVSKVGEVDLVITTYALAHRDRETLEKIPWHRIVLDEAQYTKNPAAKQTQAVRAILAERRIALTGTPVENRLAELWSIMDFLNPGYLGTATNFRTRFAVPVERYRDARRGEQLRGLIRPFILRRLKTDPTVVADLPEKIESREYCHLTTEQATLYEQCVKRMLAEVERSEGIQRRGLVLATLIKLKQICNHPSQMLKDMGEGLSPAVGRSGKCIRLIEMLGEVLAEGDRALVFTQFRQMGNLLVQMLQRELGRDVLFLHGGTPQKQRTAMVESFQSPGSKHPILVVSLKAGGVGLNLTAATHVFHFDRWWNPAVENQATDRAYRIGQTRTVQVHKFVVRGTLEERIDEMIEKKTELAENIIGAGERWLTDLSTDDLRDILTLRRDAVGDEEE